MTDHLSRLVVSHDATGGVHAVAVAGEIDYLNADDFTGALAAVAFAEGETVELDLARVPFCDSAGLAALVGLRHRVVVAGAVLRLVAVDPQLRRTLEMTGLSVVFDSTE